MVGEVHGLDLVWEVQLLVDDFIDQELIGNNLRLEKKDFYSAWIKFPKFQFLTIF